MFFNSLVREITVRFARNLAVAILLLSFSSINASAKPVTVVVFGDSLSAGYGLAPGEGFPEQLAILIDDPEVEIINAGVSGDTTTGGLARLDWSVPEGTSAVILELGANDALRAVSPDVTRANLEKIILRLKQRGITVMLAGMKAPPNMGRNYVDAFDGIYPQLAQQYSLSFYPFFLNGVAGVRHLNQADGIHPTREGIKLIAEQILPFAKLMIEKINAN